MNLAKRISRTLVLVVGLSVSPAWADHHEGPPAVQVVAVDTHGNTDEYIDALKALKVMLQRLSPGAELRVYEAAFAGPTTGTVYVVINFPTLGALTKATLAINADKAWAAELKKLDAIGRTLESNSILLDRTPK